MNQPPEEDPWQPPRNEADPGFETFYGVVRESQRRLWRRRSCASTAEGIAFELQHGVRIRRFTFLRFGGAQSLGFVASK